MDDHNTPQSDWRACPAGQVSGMLRTIERRQRNTLLRRVAVGAAIVLGAAFAPQMFSRDVPTPLYGGICCEDVQKQAATWLAGNATPAVDRQMQEHLQQCPHCPKLINQMRLQRGGAAALEIFSDRLVATR